MTVLFSQEGTKAKLNELWFETYGFVKKFYIPCIFFKLHRHVYNFQNR